jgi:hypothetical protein
MLSAFEQLSAASTATHTSTFSAAMNASCGMSTLPNWRMRFLPPDVILCPNAM